MMRLLHKLARYTKEQKSFVLYLIALFVVTLIFPLLKVMPVDGKGTNFVFLLSGSFFKPMLIIYATLLVLMGRNMSFRFKNFVINFFGFREADSLFNFIFLWVLIAAYLSIGATVNVVQKVTATVDVAFGYYLVQLLLIGGLILTLLALIKKAKKGEKTRIVNIVNEEAEKEAKGKKDIEGLFGKKMAHKK